MDRDSRRCRRRRRSRRDRIPVHRRLREASVQHGRKPGQQNGQEGPSGLVLPCHLLRLEAWSDLGRPGRSSVTNCRQGARCLPDAENVLLEIVGDTVEETKKVLDYWRNDVDVAGVRLDIEEQLGRRHFDLSRRANGMIAGQFELPRLAGETLLSAVDALMPPPATDDSRTTSQRRADALEDLARSFLDGSETPLVGGERPHVNVHVDLDAIEGKPGGLHETEDGVVLDADSLRQLMCDSSVSRIVFGPGSEVLDIGRKTRVIPAALRRAVIARDRHCTWPGCNRSPRWCDVHHIISWADGGETVIGNLCLLCRCGSSSCSSRREFPAGNSNLSARTGHHTLTHLEIVPEDELSGRRPARCRKRRSI
jgi:hypothetical protein